MRAEKSLKIGETLTSIMRERKIDKSFLSVVCDISVSTVEDIISNKCVVGLSQVSKLADALNVDEEELALPAAPVSIQSGRIGKIVGILNSGGQQPTGGVLVQFGKLVARPFWSTSHRFHLLLGDTIDIISPKSLTHVLTARHCCIYQSLENINRYTTLVRVMGCGFRFCDTRLNCASTKNKYFIVLPRLGKNIDRFSVKVGASLPSVPIAEQILQ